MPRHHKEVPLHHAAAANNTEITETLLAREANIDSQDTEETTPLHSAVEVYAKDTVALLLRRGAKVNAQNSKKYSPPHTALTLDLSLKTDEENYAYKSIIQLLLQHWAYSQVAIEFEQILKNTGTMLPMTTRINHSIPLCYWQVYSLYMVRAACSSSKTMPHLVRKSYVTYPSC